MTADVTFLFTNPGHHLASMAPVAAALSARGVSSQLVSLSELRGFRTPTDAQIPIVQALPALRSSSSAGSDVGTSGGAAGLARRAVKRAVWGALAPRVRWLTRKSRVAVVPNDAAWPYAAMTKDFMRRGLQVALLQEGIRFPLPREQARGVPYGAGGAEVICTWGEASAEHFRTLASAATVRVTGTPRFDDLNPRAWDDAGSALLARLNLHRPPLLFLSNTIDDQGFCTTAGKMALFHDFLAAAGPALEAAERAVVVKLHPREDLAVFRRVAAELAPLPVHVVDAPLNAVLAAGAAAVVLASTVGLEALMFGLPLGVLEIPGHGHVFEYVERGAAIGLSMRAAEEGVARLLATDGGGDVAEAFVERHIAHRTRAANHVADQIQALQETTS